MSIIQRWRDRGRRARTIAQAERLIQQGQYEAAARELLPLVDADPADAIVARKAIEAYAELGRADDVASRLAALIEADPQQVTLVNNASFDDIRSTDAFRAVYEAAVRAIAEQLAGAPEDAAARLLLAEYYEVLGRAEAAHAEYAVLAQDDDAQTRARAAYLAARLHLTDGDVDEAAARLRDAVAEAPELLAACRADEAFEPLFDSGVMEEMEASALAAQEEALRAQVTDAPENPLPRRRLVALLRARDRDEEALALTHVALEDFPTDAELLEAQADCLFDMERYDEALTSYQEALRLHQGRAWPVYRAGAIYERQGLPDAARSAYWDALDTTRDDAAVALLISRGMARIEDRAGLFEALRRAAQLSATLREPSPEELLAAIAASDEFGPHRHDPEFTALVTDLEAEMSVNAPGL
ncbi:hypothetical protein CMK11_01495 [Candidatus Poribacteria bacterium]|nr:hypothetical protein [Candidatus Poribacteria bacterium]